MNQNTNYTFEPKVCCVCKKQLFGRSDKVFCDIKCKNHFHSHLRKHDKPYTSETIKILLKNYQILSYLRGKKSNKFEVSKLELERLGFNFDTVTSFELNVFGVKTFLFDFSWYQSSNRKIVVSKNADQSPVAPYLYRRWEIHYKKFDQQLKYSKKE